MIRPLMRRARSWLARRVRAVLATKAAPLAADGSSADIPIAADGSTPYSRRERFIITDLVFSRLLPHETFSILDGGARGGPSDPRWRSIGDERLVIHGFEVDEAECGRLNREASESDLRHHYYPVALWSSEGSLTIYENKAAGGGSAYPQNLALTNRWKFQNATQKFDARDIFYPIGEVSFATTTIDSWARKHAIAGLDFLKLNVQGAELEILKGAPDTLKSIVGMQLEVSFVESYFGRPFFADVDAFVRRQGFHFFDLVGLHYLGRAASPVTSMHTPGLYPLHGQLIEAHGLYFRDPLASSAGGHDDNLSADQVLKLAAIAEIYGQVEYAFELLGWLSGRLREGGDMERSRDIATLCEEALRMHHRYLSAPLP